MDLRCNTGLLDSAVISKVLVSLLADMFWGTAGVSVGEEEGQQRPRRSGRYYFLPLIRPALALSTPNRCELPPKNKALGFDLAFPQHAF